MNAHDASKIRYGASMVQAGSATVFLMNRDESEWIGMSVIPDSFRMPTSGH